MTHVILYTSNVLDRHEVTIYTQVRLYIIASLHWYNVIGYIYIMFPAVLLFILDRKHKPHFFLTVGYVPFPDNVVME